MLPRRAPQRRRDLAIALIVGRRLDPAAKLATARMLDPATARHLLGEMLGLGNVPAREVYATLDWLGSAQNFIETTRARRHLKNGALLLYDVTSTPAFGGRLYLEGRCCEPAQYGYSRDHRRVQRASKKLRGAAAIGQARGLTAHAAVRAYKSLSGVERAFCTFNMQSRPSIWNCVRCFAGPRRAGAPTSGCAGWPVI